MVKRYIWKRGKFGAQEMVRDGGSHVGLVWEPDRYEVAALRGKLSIDETVCLSTQQPHSGLVPRLVSGAVPVSRACMLFLVNRRNMAGRWSQHERLFNPLTKWVPTAPTLLSSGPYPNHSYSIREYGNQTGPEVTGGKAAIKGHAYVAHGSTLAIHPYPRP